MPKRILEASKYVLVVVGVVILAIIALHGWFAREETPSTLVLGGLIVFAILPVADRIKVLDIIDFRRSISNLSEQMDSSKSQVEKVTEEMQNLSQAMSLSISSQETQQIFNTNISVASEAMALELAKQIGVPQISRRDEEETRSASNSEDYAVALEHLEREMLVVTVHL